MGRVSPNYYVQDGVIPRTKLSEVLGKIRALEQRSGLRIGNVFHAGDGNLHPLICYDEQIPGQGDLAEHVASEILMYCIDAGGSITGEHGVGADKSSAPSGKCSPRAGHRHDAAAAMRVRSGRHLQPGQSVPHAASLRRSAGPLSPASRRSGRASRNGSDLNDATRHTPADAVDGVVPKPWVVEPATADEVAATLERASRERAISCHAGRRHKDRLGPCAGRDRHAALNRRGSNAVVAHRHGDLTATVQAGAPLAAVNQQLAQHRQWIPLDPPWADRATIGGMVATNDSGPRRHRYGAPRDLIIGVEFARADGQLAKGGGIVVKNVAGYDMPRLMTGSFGASSVIITATFKLFPLTTASKTLVVELKDPRGSRRAVRRHSRQPSHAHRARV